MEVPNSFLLVQLSWYEPPHSFKHIAYKMSQSENNMVFWGY